MDGPSTMSGRPNRTAPGGVGNVNNNAGTLSASSGTSNPGSASGNVSICLNGQAMSVPASQLNNYLSSGASVGPCNTTASTGGNGGSYGNGGVGSNGGQNGGHQGGSYGNGGVGHNGGHQGGSYGNGGVGYNSGGNVGYNNGGNVGFNGAVVSGANCPPNYYGNTISTTNVTFYSGGSRWDCTPTYYCYGNNYYNSYTSGYGFGGYAYTGVCNGVSYQLMYPDLDPGCNFVAFYPYRNRRVSILESPCGTFHWRVVERRTWIPGAYYWDRGCRRWQGGYWDWRMVRKTRVYDYWDCISCYW